MRENYGTKYVCYNCAAKFYNLNKPQAICPLCDADQAKRPKKKEKKAFRKFDVEERTIDDLGSLDTDSPDETPLIDAETVDLDDGIADGASFVVETAHDDDD